MDTQPPPPGDRGSNTGRLAGATSNTESLATQQERRHKLVHRDAANVATKHMTQDAHLKIVRKTGTSKTKKQHAAGCEFIQIEENGRQLTI
jgi:GTP cyclohydrolase III